MTAAEEKYTFLFMCTELSIYLILTIYQFKLLLMAVTDIYGEIYMITCFEYILN